jgi:hypothetical protein
MPRLATLFWILLVSAVAGGMYAVKYRVQGIEHTLIKTEMATIAEKRQLHVLDAEWAYLNRPSSLAQLNARFLSLVPITAQQLRASVADIPMRAAPDKGAPQGKFVAVAANSSAPLPLPRMVPAVLREGPAAGVVPRDAPVPAHAMARLGAGHGREVRAVPDGRAAGTATQAAPRPRLPRRNRSLDALIASIVASR